MNKILLVVALGVMLTGCSNAVISQYTSIGSPADVTCYSGGQVFYHGRSTGKVATEEHSDGWFFQEEGSNRMIRISGSCVIRN